MSSPEEIYQRLRTARRLLEYLMKECKEHNAEYHHVTDESLLGEVQRFLDAMHAPIRYSMVFATKDEANAAALRAAKEYIDAGKVPDGWTLVTVPDNPEKKH